MSDPMTTDPQAPLTEVIDHRRRDRNRRLARYAARKTGEPDDISRSLGRDLQALLDDYEQVLATARASGDRLVTPAEAEADLPSRLKGVGTYAVQVAKQAYDDGFAAGLASAAPSPPDALDREAVARVVDPEAFKPLVKGWKDDSEGWEDYARGIEHRREIALAKADQILALAPARGWRPLIEKPKIVGGVLLWFPLNHSLHANGSRVDLLIGQDYRMKIGWWDGERFLEQGTSHDVLIEAYGDEDRTPTHWQPLPPAPETKL